jgi:tetratricopeptide (TPR) repeat protein
MKPLEFPPSPPSGFDALLSACEEYQRTQFARLESLSAADLDRLTDSRFDALPLRTLDEKAVLGSCFVMNCLIRLAPERVSDLISQLKRFPASKNDDCTRFVALISARIYKYADSAAITSEIHDSKSTYFLSFLAKESPKSVLLNADLFLKMAVEALNHQNPNVVSAAGAALTSFLDLIEKKAGPSSLNDYRVQLYSRLESNTPKGGVSGQVHLCIILCRRKMYPAKEPADFFRQLRQVFWAVRGTKESVQDYVLLVLALAAPMDLDTFREQHLMVVNEQYRTGGRGRQQASAEAFVVLFRLYPDVYLAPSMERFLWDIIRAMLFAVPEQAFNLLLLIADHPPSPKRTREASFGAVELSTLLNALKAAKITKEFAEKVPLMLKKVPAFREKYLRDAQKQVQTAPPDIALAFFACCPPLSEGACTFHFRDLLQHKDPRIRAAVPAPMMIHSAAAQLGSHVNELLTVSLTDPDADTRRAIVKSFLLRPVDSFLVTPSSMDCLQALVNDQSFDVQCAVVELLTHLNVLHPFKVLPIFRRVILDDMFVLGSPRPQRRQTEMTRLLHMLIRGANDILPSYASSICQLSLSHFTTVRNSDLTVFERENVARISIDLAQAIELVATCNIAHIAPNPGIFIDALIANLKRHDRKDVNLAVASALTVLLTKAKGQIDRRSRFIEIATIATEWHSRKLNEAFLKLLGLLGASDFCPPEPDDDEFDPSAYVFRKTTEVLLRILDDPSLNVHHFKVYETFVRMFQAFKQAGAPDDVNLTAHVFVPRLIADVRAFPSPKLIRLLVSLCRDNEAPWLPRFAGHLMSLVTDLAGTPVLPEILGLIPALAQLLREQFTPYAPSCVSLLLHILELNRKQSLATCTTVLRAFVVISSCCGADAHFHDRLFRGVLETAAYSESDLGVRRLSLNVLRRLVPACNCGVRHAAAIFQCALGCLPENDLKDPAMRLLSFLIRRLPRGRPGYIRIMDQLREAIGRCGLEKYETDVDPFPDVSGRPPPLPRAPEMPTYFLGGLCRFSGIDTAWFRKEWFRALVFKVITRSPHPWIRSVSHALVRQIPQVSHGLFDIAFLTCWVPLTRKANSEREMVREGLTEALCCAGLSPKCKLALINLVEFADRAQDSLEIIPSAMYWACRTSGHLAKAWYFANRSYQLSRRPEAEEALIEVAGCLQLRSTVAGLARVFARRDLSERMGDYLGYWSNPLGTFDGDGSAALRRNLSVMKWEEVAQAESAAPTESVAACLVMAHLMLGHYAKVCELLPLCKREDSNSLLFGAIAKDKLGDKEGALETIQAVFTMIAERAKRSYRPDNTLLYTHILEAMRLTEVSEFITGDYNEEVGRERLKLCPTVYPVYLSVIAVRWQYTDRLEQMRALLTCTLKTENWECFDSLMRRLSASETETPEVRFLAARSLWERGQEREALDIIMQIEPPEDKPLFASKICSMKARWVFRSGGPVAESLQLVRRATELNPNNAMAWYRWGWVSAAIFEKDHSDNGAAIEAIQAFLQYVRLRPDVCFPDLVEVVTIFFAADLTPDNFRRVSEWISSLPAKFLLRVIPQFLAQLNRNDFVATLLSELLKQHFHVLLYPLLLREPASKDILDKFRLTNPDAVEQAETIRRGLLKCSSQLFDKWLDWIQQMWSRRLFNTALLIDSMQEELDRDPTSDTERLFYGAYRSDLSTIVRLFRELREIPERCRLVVEAVQSQLQMISLLYFAPELCQLKNSVLAVPGTYAVDSPICHISHFLHSISIVGHERRVVIIGKDGREYTTVLKCQSDLRVEQHVMPFFDLMNMHIKNCFPKDLRSLGIHCYSVTPLSRTSGLVQCIANTDSIEGMIRSYRAKIRRDDPELGLAISDYISDIDQLTAFQRLEFYNHAVNVIPDSDLREAIWLHSGGSQAWLVKTLRFVRTSAIMSILGHIVGLGDRRPSQILISTSTGDSIHIGFGACFEAAAHRQRFPDVVPFRLTRMMISAFGVAGVEGEFRLTAELTMKNVRSHRESIMAVLGIFRHDRLLAGEQILEIGNEYDGVFRVNVSVALGRIQRKVDGLDVETGRHIGIEENIARLIDEATNIALLARMPAEWSPLW